MGIDKEGYYSYREILGYSDCTYFFVLGDRGRGKSYGAKKMLLASDEKFMCLYRNTGDLELGISDWLDPMYNEGYAPEQFEWEKLGKSGGANLLMNGVVKGYFRALSQTTHIKLEFFGDKPDDYVGTIFFDEFIPVTYRKLNGTGINEAECVRVIAKTVDHDTTHPRTERGMKPLKVIMVANPFTWDNPILSGFHVIPRGYGIYRIGPGIVLEMLEPYEKEKKGGKMTIDEFLGDEVNRSQGWMEEYDYVLEKWPVNAVPEISVRLEDEYYGMYTLRNNHVFYIRKEKKHMNVKRVYGTLKGLKEDEWCIDDSRSGKTMAKNMLADVMAGRYRFKDLNTKFDFIRALQ